MQTLPCTSLKNNYLYQILINLASILTRAYNFMIKRIPWGFNIFTSKNTKCYVSLPIPYIGPSISRDHQTLANEPKNILFLNASAKVWDARETSCHLVLMGNCLTCCPTHVLSLLSHQCFVNSPFWVFWEAWDPAATKKVLHEKNMGLKSMQVNASKSITRMTKRGVYMRTD